jgi:hypothetical protein
LWCGNTVGGKRPDAIFCSDACAKASNRVVKRSDYENVAAVDPAELKAARAGATAALKVLARYGLGDPSTGAAWAIASWAASDACSAWKEAVWERGAICIGTGATSVAAMADWAVADEAVAAYVALWDRSVRAAGIDAYVVAVRAAARARVSASA